MYRSAIILGLYLSFAIAIGAACSAPAPLETRDDDDSSSNPPRGGSSNGGSVTTQGGSSGMGGTMVGNGGTMVANGGSLPMNGGTSGSAGAGTGGATANGGTMSGAGRAAMGGSAGTGTTMGGTGNMPMGGTTAMGGSTSGSAGTGTSTVSCDATFAVSNAGLVRAPMKGGACWHGYASAGADDASTGTPTTFATCGEACKLTVAGELVAADDSYAYLGFNVNEASGSAGKIAPTGMGVKVTFSKTGTFDVRVQIASGSTRWCATATSGTVIPWTSLKTECWGTEGTAYAKEPIDQIQLNVPGKMADVTTYSVTLTSVEEM